MASAWPMIWRTNLLFSCLCWFAQEIQVHVAATPTSFNCTHDIDCHHGGMCVKTADLDTSCRCQPGWTGQRCEEKVVLASMSCLSKPCKHGGTCQVIGDHFVCHCDVYWTGAYCEEFKGLPDSPPISTLCSSSDFQCYDGTCVVAQSLCDGIGDCPDGSDEATCSSEKPHSQCAQWENQCEDGLCIPRYKWCDLFKDCRKGEDELNCRPEIPEDPQRPPQTISPHSGGLNFSNLLIISCTMVIAVLVISILVYVRRVRSSQRRLYSPVSWTLNQHGDGISMPYHVSQHANFCHHLPPHRCPRTNGLVGFPLGDGITQGTSSDEPDVLLATLEITQGQGNASGRGCHNKEGGNQENDVPPTYLEVIKSDARQRSGDETPPPSYEDL
ncbi:uncharacterized protein [Diadema setosum]|uniref:uncharacterized protein n=1 Tax=Diadema setosum TaxID=31175 RepID=UPI003B3BD78C